MSVAQFIGRYPLWLLLWGPPLWRSYGERSATASLSGSVDFWILLQIAFYLAAGAIGLLQLLPWLQRKWPQRNIWPILNLAGIISLLIFSALFAPGFLSAVAISILFLLGVLSAISFAINATASDRPLLDFFGDLRFVCGALAVLILASRFLGIGDTVRQDAVVGGRVFGGRVGYMPALAWMIYAISLWFLLVGRDRLFKSMLWIGLGLLCVLLTKTRATYLIVIITTLAMVAFSLFNSSNIQSAAIKFFVGGIIATMAIGVLMVASERVWNTLTRGASETNITTLSARTLIRDWALEKIDEKPLGLGYPTGFRYAFLTMPPAQSYYYRTRGLLTEKIGNAHNAYLEILVGAGWQTFLPYVLFIAMTLAMGCRTILLSPRGSDQRYASELALIMFGGILVHQYVYSNYLLPPCHEFAMLLFVVSLLFVCRERSLESDSGRGT